MLPVCDQQVVDMAHVPSEENRDEIFRRLQRLHLAAAIFMGIQAVAYGIAAGNTTATTIPSVSFQAGGSDDFCEALTCEVNIRGLKKFNAIFLVPLFVALASADHIACYLYSVYFESSARTFLFELRSNPLRWLEYSVSASAMALAIAILCRITDVHIWFLVFTLTATGMWCGYVLELISVSETSVAEKCALHTTKMLDRVRYMVFTIGTSCIFAPWMVMLCYFFEAATRPGSTIPDFVYAAFLVTLVFFALFGLNSLLCNVLGRYPFHRAEFYYILLSFTAKTFLAADVFGGLAAADN